MNNRNRVSIRNWVITTMLFGVFSFSVPTRGDIWRDDFTGERVKDAWTKLGANFDWEVHDGLLHVKQVRAPLLQGLELTAFSGPHQRLIITATGLKTKESSFGIALGKEFPPAEAPNARWLPHHYIFFTHRIFALIFTGLGTGQFKRWVPKHPGTQWETKELDEVVLMFDAGRFQMFGNGEMRADFVDEHFDQIEIITIVIGGNELITAEAWMDSFTISAPSLAVHPQGKIATTWGALKAKR